MEILTSYKELCLEIEYFEVILQEIEDEWKLHCSTLIGHPNQKRTSLSIDSQTANIDALMYKHTNIEKLLDLKKRLKKQVELIINKFDGIEYKVAYKRFVEKKTLEQIALELNYSLDGIKKISSRIKRALERH